MASFESDLAMFIHVKEVRAPQMRVWVRLPCPKPGRIDRDFDRRREGIRGIVKEHPTNIFKVAADISHHHMTHANPRRCMPRLKNPFSHLVQSFQGTSGL